MCRFAIIKAYNIRVTKQIAVFVQEFFGLFMRKSFMARLIWHFHYRAVQWMFKLKCMGEGGNLLTHKLAHLVQQLVQKKLLQKDHYPWSVAHCLKSIVILWVINTGYHKHRLQLSRNLRDSPGFSAIVPGTRRLYYSCIVGPRWGPDTSMNTSLVLQLTNFWCKTVTSCLW